MSRIVKMKLLRAVCGCNHAEGIVASQRAPKEGHEADAIGKTVDSRVVVIAINGKTAAEKSGSSLVALCPALWPEQSMLHLACAIGNDLDQCAQGVEELKGEVGGVNDRFSIPSCLIETDGALAIHHKKDFVVVDRDDLRKAVKKSP